MFTDSGYWIADSGCRALGPGRIRYPKSNILQSSRIQHPPSNIKHPLSSRTGTTLVELITAVTVAAILTTLVFMSYTAVQRTFGNFSTKSGELHKMVQAKARIDRIMRSIENVVELRRDNSLVFTDAAAGRESVLIFKDSTLVIDNKPAVRGLQSFGLRTVGAPDRGGVVVVWDAVLESGVWIGGARAIAAKGAPLDT